MKGDPKVIKLLNEALKAELSEMLVEKYEGEVMGVYFTDYVTQ